MNGLEYHLFISLPIYLWDGVLEVRLLGRRISVSVILLDIAEFSSTGGLLGTLNTTLSSHLLLCQAPPGSVAQ